MINLLDRSLEEGSFPDYGARRGKLGDLVKKAADLRKRRKQRGQSANKSALMGGRGGGGAGPPRVKPKEDSNTIGLADSDLVQVQEQVMRQQDQSLDTIHAQVRRVNEMARNIGDEGKLQDRLLDEVYDEQESVNRKMRAEQSRMDKVLRSAGNGKGMCVICLLVGAIVVICLIFFKVILN
jgi:hypothetical protein